MTIGERIKARRIQIGLTVDQVADRIGKNRATVYRYESNDIEKFPLDILPPLAKVLNTTPAYLMGWSDAADVRPSLAITVPPNLTPDLTPDETDLLRKYRALDDSGRGRVRNVLDYEYNALPGSEVNSIPKEA